MIVKMFHTDVQLKISSSTIHPGREGSVIASWITEVAASEFSAYTKI